MLLAAGGQLPARRPPARTPCPARPLLQRLQGRFPVTVELQDTDVEQVTREVVLKKKPTAEAGLKKLLDDHSGEIERQLASTKIAFSSRDRGLLVQDYPILPVRRRFWERVLRAVDKAGTGAQLRNQLWVVYDAVKQTAEWPLGNVVSGAFIYEHRSRARPSSRGRCFRKSPKPSPSRRRKTTANSATRLCALIFLIGQLPHNNEPLDAGVRADADTLADLLVTDLTKSSAELRKKVPILLEKLVTAGAIMQVENEYRMQTREGSEWNQTFLEARNKLLNDAGKLASERSQLLRSQCSEVLKKFKLAPRGQQGIAEDRPALRRRAAANGRLGDPGVGARRLGGRREDRPRRRAGGGRLDGDRLRLHSQEDGRGTEAGHRRLLRRHDHAASQGDALRRRGHPRPQGDGDAPGAVAAVARQPHHRHPERDAGLPRRRRQHRRDAAQPEDPGRGNAVPGPALPACSIRPTPPTGTRSSTGPRRATAMPWPRSVTRATRRTTRSARRSSITSAAARRGPKFASSSAARSMAGPRTPSTPP